MQTAADLQIPRLLYTSTCQTYGAWDFPNVPPLHLPFDETHPLQPQNIYALGKSVCEQYARWLSKTGGLSIAIFRLPAVINHAWEDEHWEPLKRKEGFIDGLGTYIAGADAARAYALAVEKIIPGCEAYHLTAPEILSLYPLAHRLKSMPDYPNLPPDWPAYKSPLLLDKAARDFGWSPAINFLDAYRQRFGPLPL